MMKNQLHKTFVLLALFAIVFVGACKEGDEAEPQLTVSTTKISIPAEGSTTEITITSNESWTISNSVDWLQLSQLSGNSGTVTVHVTANMNSNGMTRSTVVVVNSSNGQSRRITVSQSSSLVVPAYFPNYNTSPKDPDATGMSSTAVQLAAKMNLGWNIGNTMEAWGS